MTSGHTDSATASAANSDQIGESGAADERERAKSRVAIRHRILDAALAVFLEYEPEKVQIEAIAERAGVSTGEFLAHFGSRTELMAELAGRLYLQGFPFDEDPSNRSSLHALMHTYLAIQKRPEIRLIWKLGAQIAADRPGGPDAAYWHLVGEIELRLTEAKLGPGVAHERALVLTPALMLVADRAARDLTTAQEIDEFVDAACNLGLAGAE